MKKSCLAILLIISLFLVGCSNNSESNIIKKINKEFKNVESYYLEGDLTIYNDIDEYLYRVEVYFKEDNYYRVNLVNQANSHEQIILKNDDGVYVITPSLNKSFKFQSNWPNDSSQIYLIESLYEDLSNSDERIFTSSDSGYNFEISANYPNNSNLVKQVIEFDNDLNLLSASVYNDDNELEMTMVFEDIQFNKDIDLEVFNMNNIINSMEKSDDSSDEISNDDSDESVISIDDIIYPLYIPTGTVLTDEEKVTKTDGERIILTFDGEKPFILVEETISIEEEFSIIPTYGEPYLLLDTIATLSDNSISWISDGIEYYLVSDVMSQIELVEIASSVTTIEQDK